MLQIAADAAGTIWSESVIELQTKVREDFTITEKATMDADAKVMGRIHDCEIFENLRLKL